MNTHLVVMWLAMQALSATANAAPGDLDLSFGPGGYVQLSGTASGLSLSDDGRIVVASEGLLRLLANGSADTSFGTAGRANVPNNAIEGLVRQPSGKLIAFGRITGGARCLGLTRIDHDGAVDTAFGLAGTVPTGPPMPCVDLLGPWAGSVAVQSTGSIVPAFGYGLGRVGPFLAGAARHLVDGAVDASFGQSGTTWVGYGREPVIAIDAADRILLARLWDAGYSTVMIRLTPSGERDQTFGQAGAALSPAGAEASIDGIAVQRDGRIVTAGVGNGRCRWREGWPPDGRALPRRWIAGSVLRCRRGRHCEATEPRRAARVNCRAGRWAPHHCG